MDGISLEQALKWSMPSLLQPLWSCTSDCHVKDAPSPKHKLPSFFADRRWDLSGDAYQEVCVEHHTDRSAVKPPGFFFDRKWDLGRAADDACTLQEERRLCFTLKPSDRFGMVLEETAEPPPLGLLVVSGVDEWSAFAHKAAGLGVKIGDVILEVNGKRGNSSEMREALVREFASKENQSREISLVVRSRPPVFNIQLGRSGKQRKRRLGFVVCAAKSNPTCLKVQGILDKGLVPTWNAAHGSLRICKGDLITHVNGISKDVQAMSKEMEDCSKTGSALRVRIVASGGDAIPCQETSSQEVGSARPSTVAVLDEKVRGLEDVLSVDSTTASLSDRSCPLGMLTPDEE
jgi:hypothetical protein